MINAISAADIAFIMSSSTSAWLLYPLECSPQQQNGWTLCFCFWGWIMWKMYNKTIIEFGFRIISWIIKASCLCYLPQPSALAVNTDLGFDNSWYHAQPHPIIVYFYITTSEIPEVFLLLKHHIFIARSEDIEDITRWREDKNFMWQEQYRTSERSERVRYCSCHENIRFISSS